MKHLSIILIIACLALGACVSTNTNSTALTAAETVSLATSIAAREAESKARDQFRRPSETLGFFGIKSDMAVAEVLPGGGWYTEILAPYLADNGAIYALDYSEEMWPLFGFFSAEEIAETMARNISFPTTIQDKVSGSINAKSASFGRVPKEDHGTIDAVLFIRALHNLHRFEAKAGTLTQALADTNNLLKTGGIVGIVQHWAPESSSDDWADGSAGYLKESRLIEAFENAGFELQERSVANANPKDQPTEEDVVWRLPPSLNTGKLEGAAKDAAIAKNTAIGESSRIMLRFIKR